MLKRHVKLGQDLQSKKSLLFNICNLIRHLWVMGATGSGKTVFLIRLFAELVRRGSCCIIVIDKMGGLAREAEKFLVSRHCPASARQRVLIIRPANEEHVFPLFPIDPTTGASEFFQVERTTDLGMRLWRSQDMALQARLRKWSFNMLFAMMQLFQNIRPTEYLLNPRSEEHEPLLRRLTGRVRHEWSEILNAKGSEPTRILESVRNRWSIFYECPQLRRMTTTTHNHLDITAFRQQKKIVIVDLSPGNNQLTGMVANGIAGMIINDTLSSARVANSCGLSLPETVVFLDEFQDFVSKDLEEALPQTRQLGLSFVFSHQSMSQLQQGEVDMSEIVWQAQTQAFFRNYGVDGDVVAEEKAVYEYDENEIKDKRTTQRQRVAGHETRLTRGGGEAATSSNTHTDQMQKGRSRGFNRPLGHEPGSQSISDTDNTSHADVIGTSSGESHQTSWRETLVPKLEDFEEVTGLTYRQFDEVQNVNRRRMRQLPVGQCFFKAADDSQFRHLGVNPLFIRDTSYIRDQVAELEEANFASDLFIPSSTIDREDELLRQQILCNGPLRIDPSSCSIPNDTDAPHASNEEDEDTSVFG